MAVYSGGRVLFESGDRHSFLDVIEKFQARNIGAYDLSVGMAEEAFRKSGKPVSIDYDGNVALVVDMVEDSARLAHILRGSDRKTTFSVSVAPNNNVGLNFASCLSASAAFLEGIQMSFFIGSNQEKIRQGIIARHSPEEKQTREAQLRLGRLTAEITNLEDSCKVNYRPEKPEFQQLVVDAEELARKVLQPGE